MTVAGFARSSLALCVLVVLFVASGSHPAGIQAPDGNTTSQTLGRIVLTLGMTESEGIRRLSEDFVVQPAEGKNGTYVVYEKGSPPGKIVGSFSTSREGRITGIMSDWTPSGDRAAAFAEALFTLLTRLSAGNSRGDVVGWRTVDSCSVNTAVPDGTGKQSWLAMVECGRQTVSISMSRGEGGASQVRLLFDIH